MIEKPRDVKRCLIFTKLCVMVMHHLTHTQNTIQLSHRQLHWLIPLIYASIFISLLLLLNVTMENLFLCWSSAKVAPFHFWGDQGGIILKEHWSECTLYVQTFYFQKSPNFQIFLPYISVSDFNWKLGQHAPHLPGGHLAVVAPRVVVPGEHGSWSWGREWR